MVRGLGMAGSMVSWDWASAGLGNINSDIQDIGKRTYSSADCEAMTAWICSELRGDQIAFVVWSGAMLTSEGDICFGFVAGWGFQDSESSRRETKAKPWRVYSSFTVLFTALVGSEARRWNKISTNIWNIWFLRAAMAWDQIVPSVVPLVSVILKLLRLFSIYLTRPWYWIRDPAFLRG